MKFIAVEVPWRKRQNGAPSHLAVPYDGNPWSIPTTLGPAICDEGQVNSVKVTGSAVDAMLKTIRIVDSLSEVVDE